MEKVFAEVSEGPVRFEDPAERAELVTFSRNGSLLCKRFFAAASQLQLPVSWPSSLLCQILDLPRQMGLCYER